MSVKVEQLDSQLGKATQKARRGSYIQQLKDELSKVTWTTKEETLFATKTVVIATFIFGIGSYLADISIRGVLNALSGFFHLIFG